MTKFLLLFSVFISWALIGRAQYEIRLYQNEIPNSTGASDEEEITFNQQVDSLISKVSNPTLKVFLPHNDKTNNTAVIICPGGGYHVLLIEREGNDIAKAFNEAGVAAFVLKYRLPSDKTMKDKTIGPLQDAQKAIQVVREHSGEWHVAPDKIGIMGFSAGGHLAATAGTHFEETLIDNKKGTSLRPDFMILIYPVISFTDSIGHIGSRNNLLGKLPSKEQILYFSNERHVCSNTPPTFITQGDNDTVVSVYNSLNFYKALNENSVPAALHIYSKAGHGYLKRPPFEEWFGRCLYWMNSNGWL